MIVSQVASESIWNMNEIEDSNKNEGNMQNDETTPKCVRYIENIMQGTKTIKKKSEFQTLMQNRLVYDELSPNLESKVNDVQFS